MMAAPHPTPEFLSAAAIAASIQRRHDCHVLGVCQGGPRGPGCTCLDDAPEEYADGWWPTLDPLAGLTAPPPAPLSPPPPGEGRGGGHAPFAPGVIEHHAPRRRWRTLIVCLQWLALPAASVLAGLLLGVLLHRLYQSIPL